MKEQRVPENLLKSPWHEDLRRFNQYWLSTEDIYSDKSKAFFEGGLIRELEEEEVGNSLWQLDLLLMTSWHKLQFLPTGWDNRPEQPWRWRANDRHHIIELSQKVLYESRLALREGQRKFSDGSAHEWIKEVDDATMWDQDLFCVGRYHPEDKIGRPVVATVLYLLGVNQGYKNSYEHGVKEKKGFEYLIEGSPTNIPGVFGYFGYRDREEVLGVSFDKAALGAILEYVIPLPPIDGIPDEDKKIMRTLNELQAMLKRRLITDH